MRLVAIIALIFLAAGAQAQDAPLLGMTDGQILAGGLGRYFNLEEQQGRRVMRLGQANNGAALIEIMGPKDAVAETYLSIVTEAAVLEESRAMAKIFVKNAFPDWAEADSFVDASIKSISRGANSEVYKGQSRVLRMVAMRGMPVKMISVHIAPD